MRQRPMRLCEKKRVAQALSTLWGENRPLPYGRTWSHDCVWNEYHEGKRSRKRQSVGRAVAHMERRLSSWPKFYVTQCGRETYGMYAYHDSQSRVSGRTVSGFGGRF